MFDLKLDSMIRMLVDQELDRKESVKILDPFVFQELGIYRKLGVYLPVFLKAVDYENDKADYTRIFMLFTGNTSVFYAHSSVGTIETIPNDSWVNTSNHDSCWRSDGFVFLHQIQEDLCRRVNPNVPPYELHTEARFTIGCSYPIRHCIVSYRKARYNSFKNEIVNIKPVEKEDWKKKMTKKMLIDRIKDIPDDTEVKILAKGDCDCGEFCNVLYEEEEKRVYICDFTNR